MQHEQRENISMIRKIKKNKKIRRTYNFDAAAANQPLTFFLFRNKVWHWRKYHENVLRTSEN